MHINTARFSLFLAGIAIPLAVIGNDDGKFPEKPFAQDVVITAYYSPLPHQCCYVQGSYEADVVLNGAGVAGADGTAVYPGMAAAPSVYPFGTKIEIPGVGTVAVHDRGGAIVEIPDKNVVRLDLWMGAGEEGLARALAFGVKRVRATVYPPDTAAPEESLSLKSFAAPLDRLSPFLASAETLLDMDAKMGDHTLSVLFLQQELQKSGYFSGKVTGVFDKSLELALHTFNQDMGLSEPSDHLTEKTAAFITAVAERSGTAEPFSTIRGAADHEKLVSEGKRVLRLLGFYKGRSDGKYDDNMGSAIVAFQKSHNLIANEKSPGAGALGPLTKKALVQDWRRFVVSKKADNLLVMHRIDQLIAEKYLPKSFLKVKDKGEQVRLLQEWLVKKGYLAADRVSGLFGDFTKAGVIAFQKVTKIISKDTDHGAGVLGPSTLSRMRAQMRQDLFRSVRGHGWDAL